LVGLGARVPVRSSLMRARGTLLVSVCLGLALNALACSGWGSGTKWVQQPLDDERPSTSGIPEGASEGAPAGPGARASARTLGRGPAPNEGASGDRAGGDRTGGGGHVLGTFRNTYYDFPRESDHAGATVALMGPTCQPIAQVPRGFYEAVCVQGSGSLKGGGTVSFSKRDCACAELCPRTGQRICFDALDKATFPWGRGAAGTPIRPLRTIAADTTVLPMGTVVYLPELDGAPRDETGEALDGCFVVEDRGLRVKGEHIDIFTGHRAHTAALEERLPSNHGVTVVVQAPRCAHLATR
jgi:3D (Asp-Asp-Asp) domain-containing protein